VPEQASEAIVGGCVVVIQDELRSNTLSCFAWAMVSLVVSPAFGLSIRRKVHGLDHIAATAGFGGLGGGDLQRADYCSQCLQECVCAD
jgi:hypothetical protein